MTLPSVDWIKCRAEYEAGETYSVLGMRYKRSKAAISKRGRAEGWVQDAEPAIRRQLSDRLAGIGKVASGNPEAREAAIAGTVDARLAVLTQHQREWIIARGVLLDALNASRSKSEAVRIEADKRLKSVTLAMQAMTLLQAGERRAHNLTNDPPADPASKRITLVLAADPYAEPTEP